MEHVLDPDPRAEFAATLATSGLPVLARAMAAGAIGSPGVGAVLEALAALTRDGYDDAALATAEEFLTTIAAATDPAEVAQVVHEQCEQVLRPALDEDAADDGTCDDLAWTEGTAPASTDDAWFADVDSVADGALIHVPDLGDVSAGRDDDRSDTSHTEHDAGPRCRSRSRSERRLVARSRPSGRPGSRRPRSRPPEGVPRMPYGSAMPAEPGPRHHRPRVADPGSGRRRVVGAGVGPGRRPARSLRPTCGRAPPEAPPPPPGGPGPPSVGRRVVVRSTPSTTVGAQDTDRTEHTEPDLVP